MQQRKIYLLLSWQSNIYDITAKYWNNLEFMKISPPLHAHFKKNKSLKNVSFFKYWNKYWNTILLNLDLSWLNLRLNITRYCTIQKEESYNFVQTTTELTKRPPYLARNELSSLSSLDIWRVRCIWKDIEILTESWNHSRVYIRLTVAAW